MSQSSHALRQSLQVLGLVSWLGLSACGPLTHKDALKDLDHQIKLEQQRQELDRLKQQNNPSPSPAATPTPALRPNAANQPPRLTRLEARLRTSLKPNDSVELVAAASDPDGDEVEYIWASDQPGLSATRGEAVVWFPGTQAQTNQSNLIILSVSDKKGGTSSGTLNIYVQADGSLLVRENRAAQPVLSELEISQPDPGQLRLQARAIDPNGGTVRYAWRASQGLLGSSSTATTTWSPRGNELGEIVIGLELSNGDGTARTSLELRFTRKADGSLSGDFRTIRGATAIGDSGAAADGSQLQGTVYGIRQSALVSASLATGQLIELARLNTLGGAGEVRELVYDGADTVYLYSGEVHAFSLSRLESKPVSLSGGAYRIFRLQGRVCALGGPPGARTVTDLATGKAVAVKQPDWLFNGEVGAQGLIARAERGTVRLLDPVKGVEQDLIDIEGVTPTLAWSRDGRSLIVVAGNQLHRLGLDGSRQRLGISFQTDRLIWFSDRILLGINGQPGKLQIAAWDPETGKSLEVSPALQAALGSLAYLEPAS